MKRAVIIDSLVDLPPFFKTTLKILSVGFKVYINGEEFTDGITITKEEFYEKASGTDDLRTSYPPPEETLEYYRELEREGVEEVLALHLPAKVSGFLNSLSTVLKNVSMKVKVIDLRSLSGGAGMVAAKLIELFEKGIELDEIEKAFWSIRKNILLQFSVKTLNFLIKNGRIGKAKGLIGKLLNILPILTVDEEGEVNVLNKIRGKNRILKTMVENVLRFVEGKDKIDMMIGWGADIMSETAMRLKEMLFEALNGRIRKYGEIRISPTVACHTGPEVFGVGVYAE